MDLKDYALGEGSPSERKAFEAQLAQSETDRHELQAIEYTLHALKSIPDEEIPRRIAFVSDPVFEPSLWQRFWKSGPQLGFVSASVLGAAILGHGMMMKPVAAHAPVAMVAESKLTQADVDTAVAKALAQAEGRQKEMLNTALSTALSEVEKRHQTERQMMAVSFDENLSLLRKQMNRMYVSSANLTVGSAQ